MLIGDVRDGVVAAPGRVVSPSNTFIEGPLGNDGRTEAALDVMLIPLIYSTNQPLPL